MHLISLDNALFDSNINEQVPYVYLLVPCWQASLYVGSDIRLALLSDLEGIHRAEDLRRLLLLSSAGASHILSA